MKKFLCLFCFVFSLMLLILPNTAMAVALPTVTNGDFELPATAKIKGWNGESGTDIPGWSSDIAAFDSGVEEGGAGGSAWRGFLLGGLSPWGSTYPEPTAWNTTNYTIQAGDQFKLSVDALDNWSEFPPGQLQMNVYFLDGAVRTSLASVTIPLTGTWTTYTLDVPDASAGVGKLLGVELANIPQPTRNPPGNTWINVDNVQFVPEPATWIMLMLGAMGIAFYTRRK